MLTRSKESRIELKEKEEKMEKEEEEKKSLKMHEQSSNAQTKPMKDSNIMPHGQKHKFLRFTLQRRANFSCAARRVR